MLSTIINLLSFLIAAESYASPLICPPAFPDKFNSDTNICLEYPPAGVSQKSFVTGRGEEAFVGTPRSPDKPGEKVGKTKGYWTGSFWRNGSGELIDSRDHKIIINGAR